MYIVDGIAYSGKEELKVEAVKVLDGMNLLVKFNFGGERLFDASQLLQFPAFEPLKDEKIFRAVKIEFGTLSWDDGKIDIAPEYLYDNGTPYEPSNEDQQI